ncbi:MAG: efflux RND transporter permease subunit [Verrucomicrobiae bacterium]|jgi:HAE1 family hydrophobic/amphiphilic exporter-1|nr:efflux RND transporter permease subunit [Verrucomicrobiae bacterium]
MTPFEENTVTRLTRFSLDRRVTMFMVFLTIIAVGVIATTRLPLEMKPRGLEGKYMSVHCHWNVGVPPETMQRISLPLEEELSTVRGLDHITTHGYKWGGRVELRFKHDIDMDVAYREVRDRVERARLRFPEEADKPHIYKHEPGAEPVVQFRIAYDFDSDYYNIIQKHIVAPLQRIDGVAGVDFRIYERELKIEIDKARAEALGVNIHQLANRLRNDNFALASGQVTDGGRKYTLKSASEFASMSAIRDLPVTRDVVLHDIAAVNYEPMEAEQLYRYNSQPANGISVNMEGEANTVATAEKVVAAIEKMKVDPALKGFDLSVYRNQGEDVIQRLDSLIQNGKLGAVLAAVVLFFFLRQFRMTMVISLAIPLCLLVALTAMHFAGKTLNGLTIMGLVICVGLLVDNSVVVAENIHRHFSSGLGRREACLRGVSEIGFAITIATCTTLIVFSSAMLFKGELRFMIKNISLPVITSIAASLGAALLFIPLCVYITLPEHRDRQPRRTPSRIAGAFFKQLYDLSFENLNTGYNRLLGFFLARRLDMAVILIALLAGTWFTAKTLNTERGTPELIKHSSINIHFPEKYSMDDRLAYLRKFETLMERNKDVYGITAHEVFYGKWYGRAAIFFDIDRDPNHPLTREEAIDKIHEDMPEEPGVIIKQRGKDGDHRKGQRSNMAHIRLVGDDPEQLAEVKEQIAPTFELLPGVVSMMDGNDRAESPSEMALYIDRDKASSIGVNPWTLVNTIGSAVRGAHLPRFNEKGRQVPMRLVFSEEDRSELADIDNIQIPTEDGRVTTVGALTRTAFLKNEDNAIRRENKRVEKWFALQLKPGEQGWRAHGQIDQVKRTMNLPEGVSFDEDKQAFKREDRDKAKWMLFLAVLFVYMLMAFFFESTLIPLSIILTIPLAGIGAVTVLKLTDTHVDQMVYTAGLLLIGIVVNNGIVLVDYANRLRREGKERHDALLLAARHRFRPIIMTALTTICGMLPLTFGHTIQGAVNFKSFGMVLIGGMTSATLFTLLAVPVFYTLIEDGKNGFNNVLASVFDRSPRAKSSETIA